MLAEDNFYWPHSYPTYSECCSKATIGNVRLDSASQSTALRSIEVSYTLLDFFWWFENIRSKDKYVHVVKTIWQVAAHTRTPNKTTRYIRLSFSSVRYLWIVGVCFLGGHLYYFIGERTLCWKNWPLYLLMCLSVFFFLVEKRSYQQPPNWAATQLRKHKR